MEGLILGTICLYTHSTCIWVEWKELKSHVYFLVCTLYQTLSLSGAIVM